MFEGYFNNDLGHWFSDMCTQDLGHESIAMTTLVMSLV